MLDPALMISYVAACQDGHQVSLDNSNQSLDIDLNIEQVASQSDFFLFQRSLSSVIERRVMFASALHGQLRKLRGQEISHTNLGVAQHKKRQTWCQQW